MPNCTSDQPLPPHQPAKKPRPRPVSAIASSLRLSTFYRMRPWSAHTAHPADMGPQIAPARSLDPGERLVRHTATETW